MKVRIFPVQQVVLHKSDEAWPRRAGTFWRFIDLGDTLVDEALDGAGPTKPVPELFAQLKIGLGGGAWLNLEPGGEVVTIERDDKVSERGEKLRDEGHDLVVCGSCRGDVVLRCWLWTRGLTGKPTSNGLVGTQTDDIDGSRLAIDRRREVGGNPLIIRGED